jgi:hypothetical protein
MNRNSLKLHLVEGPVTYGFTLHLTVRDHTTFSRLNHRFRETCGICLNLTKKKLEDHNTEPVGLGNAHSDFRLITVAA